MLKENNQTPSDTTEANPSKATGFAFPPVSENETQPQSEQPTLATDPRLTTSTPEESPEKTEEKNVPPTLGVERVIPQTSSSNKHKPESDSAKIPSKYRRLLIVILIILALLLVFFLLKPQTPETVESLQEQGTSLPIEFRPVDEEEAKRAEEEAKALQVAQQQTSNQEQDEAQLLNSSSDSQEISLNTSSAVTNNEQDGLPVSQPLATSTITDNSTNTNSSTGVASANNGSAVNRSESVNTSRSSQRTTSRQSSSQTSTVTRRTSQQPATQSRNTRSQEPSQARTRSNTTTSNTAISPDVVSIKTLTVPRGVSLMQVFRDNDLNISDVNAMNKVNDILSHLQAGEKITVYLDKNNRVVEMQIASAGRFVRQADGSYKYMTNRR